MKEREIDTSRPYFCDRFNYLKDAEILQGDNLLLISNTFLFLLQYWICNSQDFERINYKKKIPSTILIFILHKIIGKNIKGRKSLITSKHCKNRMIQPLCFFMSFKEETLKRDLQNCMVLSVMDRVFLSALITSQSEMGAIIKNQSRCEGFQCSLV